MNNESVSGAKVTSLTALHCLVGGSDKVWAAAVIEEVDGSALMISCWGARGGPLTPGKTPFASVEQATKVFNSKSKEKAGKNYQPIDCTLYGISAALAKLHPAVLSALASADLAAASVTATAATPLAGDAARVVVNHVTMLRDSDLAGCLASLDYGVTEKANGTRCVVSFDGTTLRSFNRRGIEQLTVPDAAQALASLGFSFVLDGERMEGAHAGGYVIFDALELFGESVRNLSYLRRIETLSGILCGATDQFLLQSAGPRICDSQSDVPGLALLVPATSAEDKRDVLVDVLEAGGEGVIIRTLSASYAQGNDKHTRKLKYLADVDAIVIGVKPGIGTGSVRLGLIRPADGAVIEIGSVRSGLRDADIAQLTQLLAGGKQPVLSVSFLLARTVGITLVEPTTSISNLRDDKLAVDCTTDQLVEVLGADRASMIASAPAQVAGARLAA